MTKSKKEQSKRAVLVTTEHRGVFFGYTELTDAELVKATSIKLTDARNCIYWRGLRGFIDLAQTGPTTSCRIGQKAATFIAHKVTSVAECTKQAAEAWEKAPW